MPAASIGTKRTHASLAPSAITFELATLSEEVATAGAPGFTTIGTSALVSAPEVTCAKYVPAFTSPSIFAE